MRFAIFTHVIHTEYRDGYYAYSPYVREMNMWIKNIQTVEVLAPLNKNQIPDKKLKYLHPNLSFTEIPALDVLSFFSAFRSIIFF